MSLKHRGSAYYGDEEIQAGQKVIDLANRGPLCSFTPPSLLPLLSFPLNSSPNLILPPFLPSIVCPAMSNEGAHMLNRRCGLLLVLLFPFIPLILTFLFPLSFHPGGLFEVSLPLPSVGSIISLGPGPPLFVCSASVGSLCSRGLVLEPTTASSSREVCVCCMYVFVCAVFLQPLLQAYAALPSPSLWPDLSQPGWL